MTAARFNWILSCAAAVSGCGGSGGDAPLPTSVAPDLAINAANATAVAGAAFSAAFESSELGGLVADDSLGAAAPASLSRLADRSFMEITAKSQLGAIPLGPVTEDCAVAGTTTLTGELANALTFTARDRITIQFMDCDEGEGQVIDGVLEFVVDSFAGDVAVGNFDLAVTLTLMDFQVSGNGETTLANGSASVRIDTTQMPLSRVEVAGDDLNVVSGVDATQQTDFNTVLTEDGAAVPIPVTLQASGDLDSSQIGGLISYATPLTFQGFAGEHPYAGEFLVNGADGTSARLIALDSQNVRIEVDADGDGAADQVIDATWQDLDG